MVYLLLLVILLVLSLLALQQYALGKRRRGFSLRNRQSKRSRKRLPADPNDEQVRKWLESDENDAGTPP